MLIFMKQDNIMKLSFKNKLETSNDSFIWRQQNAFLSWYKGKKLNYWSKWQGFLYNSDKEFQK